MTIFLIFMLVTLVLGLTYYFIKTLDRAVPEPPEYIKEAKLQREVRFFNKQTNQWEDIEFPDLKRGMLFALYYLGNRLSDNNGDYIWVAESDAYVDKEGMPAISTKE